MSHIRFRNHYLHTAYLLLGTLEFGLLFATLFLLQMLQQSLGINGVVEVSLPKAFLFATVLSVGTLAMGVYLAMVREGFASMFFRTLVAFCFLGGIGLTLIYLLVPNFSLGSSNLFWGVLIAVLLVLLIRNGFLQVVDSDQLVRRVLVFGAGEVAENLLRDYEHNKKSLGVRLVGCVPDMSRYDVPEEQLVPMPENWFKYCRANQISEIVIAPKERRRNENSHLPMAELMECKLRGIAVTDALSFYERELRMARLDLVHPSWILYSDGFKASRWRDSSKRLVDLVISLTLAIVTLPLILLTALAVFLETGRPILYSQDRVGANGRVFRIYKFRSMSQDAEKEGKAVWASENDSRITRVGAFIRNTRLDELPQLYNVIKGEMSIVGPRPERPEFVEQLKEQVPFYDTRHYVKPGLMGWAQLNYPYGASVEDARGKLEYDLYYSKNHSLLIDLLIMIQTVEVILLGKGVR